MPFAYDGAADLGARLAQLFTEGYGQRRETDFVLTWDDLYGVLRHPELSTFRAALFIPPESTARPFLSSKGALLDADFSMSLADWVDPQGRPVRPTPKLAGSLLHVGQQVSLLPESQHRLLGELRSFHATPATERTKTFKEQFFARVRRLATEHSWPVSDYVARTVILTPERLKLGLRDCETGDTKTVEVTPGFEDAPSRWLEMFDRLPLQDSYDIPDGPSLVRVVVSPEVKTVLGEIKRMPGRRASGPRAEAFVRNPFSVLGELAEKVIDHAEFEQARVDAGIAFERFTPQVQRGGNGGVERVGLLIEELRAEGGNAEVVWFRDRDELAAFVERLARRLDQGAQCCIWDGHELEILGDTADHLQQLRSWLAELKNPSLWSAEEVLDLTRYSERVEAIGEEAPFLTPVIVRNDEGGGWFENNVSTGVQVTDPVSGEVTRVPMSFDAVPSLQEAVRTAKAAVLPTVPVPGLQTPVPIADAARAVAALLQAQQDLRQGQFDPKKGSKPADGKKRLIIKRNLDTVDYSEERSAALSLPEGKQPVLPRALRPEVELREHQRVGIAWLQHLWGVGPEHCRGTVLADDMGLGKTLQLLTFIVSCFEANPSLPPSLVVAPVALMENWRNELEAFFQPDTLPLLMLYGDELRRLRVSRHEIDEELKQQGVTRLLKKGWVGDARLVLTTYETMRDLEFAMASEPWSIMVCDEAQKIKTPAALVTRSAKKQKVRFRIACTGTPVENTLADLWCLFDFVQPGMLGALSQFSRTYRQPIEAKTEEQKLKVEELREIIRPQILHRKKSDVARDLPAPTEDGECKRLPMSDFQLQLYERALQTLREQRETNPSAQLQTLLAIRQICSDPHGYAEPDVRSVTIQKLVNESPKMGWLVERLKALASEPQAAHKAIIFCEFRELQLTIQRVVAAFFGFAPHVINGDTSADPKAAVNRQKLIDAFQRKPGFGAIILSPLAVGFGVNIQAANHVIHFTRTWNPAKEDQATARAYRIGQKRTVAIYYPGVVSDEVPSFDVRLDALLSRKRALAADMLNGCSDLTVADFAEFGA